MSFPAYPEYKDSGVEWLGEVPSHWDIRAIRHLFQVIGGSTPKSDHEAYWGGDIPWITPADLSRLRTFKIKDSARRITPEGLASCGTTMVPAGSIVLSTRAPIGSLGVAGVSLCTNQGCKALVSAGPIMPRFYAYLFSVASEELNIRGKGTTFLELSSDALAAFRVPAPSEEEQQAIAAFLDRETGKIDALVAEQEKLIELLKEKRQAVISHAVTKGLDPNVPMKDSGVEWLGEVPEHWEVVPLRRVVRRIEQGWSPSSEERFPDEGQWGVLKTSSVKGGRFDPTKVKALADSVQPDLRYAVREGDVLMIRGSGSPQLVGSAAYVNGEPPYTMLPDLLYRLVYADDKIDGGYLTYCLSSSPTRHQIELAARGIDILKIAQPSIAELRVAVPPLFEQRRIAEHLGETDSGTLELIGTATTAIDLLKERRSALISAAVTGKIDVRGLVAPEVTEAA